MLPSNQLVKISLGKTCFKLANIFSHKLSRSIVILPVCTKNLGVYIGRSYVYNFIVDNVNK